jgi:hypothetical protein
MIDGGDVTCIADRFGGYLAVVQLGEHLERKRLDIVSILWDEDKLGFRILWCLESPAPKLHSGTERADLNWVSSDAKPKEGTSVEMKGFEREN